MSASDKNIFGCLGILIFTIAFPILIALLRGWVISIMWSWFIVPIFELPILTILQAIGLSLIIGLFTSRSSSSEQGRNGDFSDFAIKAVATGVSYQLIPLAIGYIVVSFM